MNRRGYLHVLLFLAALVGVVGTLMGIGHAESIVVVDAQVGSSGDDAYHTPQGWPGYSHAATIVTAGARGSNGPQWGGWRWVNLNIPAGATITASYVDLYQSGWGYQITTKLSLENAASPAVFSSASSPFHRWSNRTGFETAWTWPKKTPGTWIRTPSLAVGLQELVDKYGGVQSLVLLENGSGVRQGQYHDWGAFDSSPDKAAKLHIVYTLGASPSPTPTPTPIPTPTPTPPLTPPGLPIVVGDAWRYFKGRVEPPASWNQTAFDDSVWPSGPSGFGYGDGDDATLLSDQQGSYWSVYLRRAFTVTDPAAIGKLTLLMDYDDGFVAYLNGVEVARANVSGTRPAYNTPASANHEASRGDTSPQPVAQFDLSAFRTLLVPGTNVLAIQGHNVTLSSSDFSLIPSLSNEVTSTSAPEDSLPIVDLHFHPRPEWNLSALVSTMDGKGVSKAGNGAIKGGDSVALSFAQQYPSRFLPFAGMSEIAEMIADEGQAAWTLQSARMLTYLAQLEDGLRAGRWKGIGELLVHNQNTNPGWYPYQGTRYPADSPLMQRLWGLSATYGVPLSVHLEPDPTAIAEMERLLASDRRGTWIWAHTGFWADTALVRRLLQTYPNLYCELSWRDNRRSQYAIDTNGVLKAEWKALMEEFPDRFLVGTDITGSSSTDYTQLISYWRGIIGQLSPTAAAMFAYQNGERLMSRTPSSTFLATSTSTLSTASTLGLAADWHGHTHEHSDHWAENDMYRQAGATGSEDGQVPVLPLPTAAVPPSARGRVQRRAVPRLSNPIP